MQNIEFSQIVQPMMAPERELTVLLDNAVADRLIADHDVDKRHELAAVLCRCLLNKDGSKDITIRLRSPLLNDLIMLTSNVFKLTFVTSITPSVRIVDDLDAAVDKFSQDQAVVGVWHQLRRINELARYGRVIIK